MTTAALFIDLHAPSGRFRDDVLAGLAASPRALSPKYFYDARGCALFEAICELPEYYPTRVELQLTVDCMPELTRLLGTGGVLVEYGSGASRKTAALLRGLQPEAYVPVDIAAEALHAATARLAVDFPRLPVIAVCADYLQPLPPAVLTRLPAARRLLYFPGSTIGNLTPGEAAAFLRAARGLAGAGGAMLVGVDLKKEAALLHAAYNDAAGVTAAFNLNLLQRINRELAGDFDLAQFRHVAFYNADAGRVEMHLESLRAQTVMVAGQAHAFAAGERIHTENSYKYAVTEFAQLARQAGFSPEAAWTDAGQRFALHLLRS